MRAISVTLLNGGIVKGKTLEKHENEGVTEEFEFQNAGVKKSNIMTLHFKRP